MTLKVWRLVGCETRTRTDEREREKRNGGGGEGLPFIQAVKIADDRSVLDIQHPVNCKGHKVISG